MAAKLVSVIGDIVIIECRDRRDHELPLVGLLEGIQLFGKLRLDRGRYDVGGVDHRCGALLGKARLGESGRGNGGHQRGNKCQHRAHYATSFSGTG